VIKIGVQISGDCTVKVSNCGPHVNLAFFFKIGLLYSKFFIQNIEENESCRKTLALQIRFSSFLVHISSKEATDLAKNGPKFP
jgi:hypothetical protein